MHSQVIEIINIIQTTEEFELEFDRLMVSMMKSQVVCFLNQSPSFEMNDDGFYEKSEGKLSVNFENGVDIFLKYFLKD